MPTSYSERLLPLNADYKWTPIGLADFRTGIRGGAMEAVEKTSDPENAI